MIKFDKMIIKNLKAEKNCENVENWQKSGKIMEIDIISQIYEIWQKFWNMERIMKNYETLQKFS